MALIAAVSALGTNIAWPSDVPLQAGDLALIQDLGNNGSSSGTVTPAGFTNIQNTSGSNIRQMFSRKFLTGAETGNLAGMVGSVYCFKTMLIFRGVPPLSAETHSTWQNQITSADPTAQNYNASGGTAPVIVIGYAATSDTVAAFSTTTPPFDGFVATSDGRALMAYKVYAAGPVNHTIDMGDVGGINILGGGYLSVS